MRKRGECYAAEKGALNRSTLDRQKRAALLLQQRRLVEERFCEELIAAEAEIEERQEKIRDLKRRLRAVRKEIVQLEQDVQVQRERERRTATCENKAEYLSCWDIDPEEFIDWN